MKAFLLLLAVSGLANLPVGESANAKAHRRLELAWREAEALDKRGWSWFNRVFNIKCKEEGDDCQLGKVCCDDLVCDGHFSMDNLMKKGKCVDKSASASTLLARLKTLLTELNAQDAETPSEDMVEVASDFQETLLKLRELVKNGGGEKLKDQINEIMAEVYEPGMADDSVGAGPEEHLRKRELSKEKRAWSSWFNSFFNIKCQAEGEKCKIGKVCCGELVCDGHFTKDNLLKKGTCIDKEVKANQDKLLEQLWHVVMQLTGAGDEAAEHTVGQLLELATELRDTVALLHEAVEAGAGDALEERVLAVMHGVVMAMAEDAPPEDEPEFTEEPVPTEEPISGSGSGSDEEDSGEDEEDENSLEIKRKIAGELEELVEELEGRGSGGKRKIARELEELDALVKERLARRVQS